MISFIRRIIDSRFGTAFALAFIALIAVGFAMGDVTGSGSFGGLGQGNIAKVGNRNIPLGEFTQAMDVQLKAERKNNPTLDKANFVEAGGLESTLRSLINRYSLAVFGEQNGIAVSKRLVDSEIMKVPGARGVDGKFSPEAFRAFASSLGVSEQMIRDDIRQNFYAEQIFPTAAAGPEAPQSLVLPYASLLLEKRAGRVAVVPSMAYLPKTPATDAQLSAYYKANAGKFTVPEKRSIQYALFDASTLGEKAKPTPADIEKYYKEHATEYAASEKRDFSQIVVASETVARDAVAKLSNGAAIASVASDLGLSVTNSQNIEKAALSASSSNAVADAIFAASQNGVASPAKGSLGWYVVKVTGVKQIAARPLASVSTEIGQKLLVDKGAEAMADLTAEMEDSFADGQSLGDVAKAQGLKVELTAKLLANGMDPANPGYKPDAMMQKMIPAAFQMEKDGDPQLVELEPGKKFAMIAVGDFEEAAPPPLAKVKEVVMQQWALAEGAKAAQVAAKAVAAAVSAGKPLADAITAVGVKGSQTQAVAGSRADLNQNGKPLAPPLAMLFAMKKGTAKTLAAPGNQGWFVVALDQVIKGDASTNKAMLDARRGEMSKMLRDEYVAQLVNAAGNSVGVTRNEGAINKLKTQLTTRDNGQ
jgi:peptidyl-prolyl cis-trans isomerase D